MEDVQQHPYKVYKGSLAQFVVVELVQDVQDRKQIVINLHVVLFARSFEHIIT
jgi:hypothetical protein